ncbi:MAG: FAD binding domain-containing protein [Deltaproteobacteria bacterium]|nr:FAD binding domain-containing protein [Deltaproteobacteria bacterium]
MHLPPFSHYQPASIEGAVRALAEHQGAKVLAGGTDLLVNMKHRVELPSALVSLSRIAELKGVRREGEATVIGAGTTLKEIQREEELGRKFPALVQAARAVGSYRHQTMGTLAGNLCQNTRCRFFNQSWQWRQARSLCFKAGGEDCHVIGRKNVCFCTYSGDVAPALLVLEGAVRVQGPQGIRQIPLAELYSGQGKSPLALGPSEVVTAVVIPEASAGRSHYEKFALRGSIDFPVVGAAVWRGDAGVRIAFTAVDRAPVRALDLEEALRGQELTDAAIETAAALAGKVAKVAPTTVHPVAFKRELMARLFAKGLRALR